MDENKEEKIEEETFAELAAKTEEEKKEAERKKAEREAFEKEMQEELAAEEKAKKKKRTNILTVVAVVVMLAAAGLVILYVKGVPSLANMQFGKSEEEKLAERAEQQSELLGEWVADDDEYFVVDVWQDGSGEFNATVNISGEEGDITFWEMTGSWQDYLNGFSYTDCVKTRVKYDADGNVSDTVQYEDGKGKIYFTDDGLVWEDDEEKTGSGVTFTWSGEY